MRGGSPPFSRGPWLRPLLLCMGAPAASVTGAQPRGATRAMGGPWTLPSSSPEPTKGVSPPSAPGRDTVSQNGRPSFFGAVTTPWPEKHVLCADGQALSSSRRGPDWAEAATRPFCETPGGNALLLPGVGSRLVLQPGRLQAPSGDRLAPWAVRGDRLAPRTGCPSHPSGGKPPDMRLHQAPARVQQHVRCVAAETPCRGVGPSW